MSNDNFANSFKIRPTSRISEKRDFKPMNVQNQANLQREIYGIQIKNKFHEIQSTLMTIKNNFDAKLAKMADPKIQIKGMMDRESNTSKQLSAKVTQLEEAIYQMRESIRKSKQSDNTHLMEFQKKVQVVEYKCRSVEKEMEGVKNLQMISLTPVNTNEGSNPQIKILREIISQEKKSRENVQGALEKKLNMLYDAQSKFQREIQKQLYEKQQEINEISKMKRQEQFASENLQRGRKGLEESNIKSGIQSIEKKLMKQINEKLNNQSELKNYIDAKTDRIRQEIMMEHKLLIDKETSFMKQTKESIQSLYGIFMTNKQQLENNLSSTQILLVENMKNLSRSIDINKDVLERKIELYSNNSRQEENQYHDLKNKVLESLKMADQRIRDLEENNENNIEKVEKNNVFAIQEFTKKMEDYQVFMNNWKTDLEKRNLQIFKQISNTLKVLKNEGNKDKEELHTKLQSIKKQSDNIQKNLGVELKKYIQSIISVFNNQFEVVVGELEILMEMINMSRNEIEKGTNSKMLKLKQQMQEQWQLNINNRVKEITLHFGKEMAKTEQSIRIKQEKQLKYLNELMNQKDTSLSTEVSILSSAFKQTVIKTESDLKAYRDQYTTFVKQYREDLKELTTREAKLRAAMQQTIKSNTTSVIESAAKRNQFVVEGMKRAIQLNALKDKTDMMGQLEKVKDQAIRNFNTLKYDLTSQMLGKLENERSERIDQQEIINTKIQNVDNNLRKSLSIEIANIKSSFEQQFSLSYNKIAQYNAEINSKMNSLRQEIQETLLKADVAQYTKELQDKVIMQQLSKDMNLLKQQSLYCFEQVKAISKLKSQLDGIESQFYEIDDKLTKQLEQVALELNNKMYVDLAFNKTNFEDQQASIRNIIQMMQEIVSGTKQNKTNIEECQDRMNQNFQVLQKAFQHTTNFLNTIDARLTIEQIYSKLSQQHLYDSIQQRREATDNT